MQVPLSKNIGIYLGRQNIDDERTRGHFIKIKGRLSSKLAGWKGRILSQAGRMVLIRSNLTGIHLYTMNGIKIPNNI